MASNTSGDIEGYVLDDFGTPLSGVLVKIEGDLYFSDASKAYESGVLTNNSGYYVFADINPFTSRAITFSKNSYELLTDLSVPPPSSVSLELGAFPDNIVKLTVVVFKPTNWPNNVKDESSRVKSRSRKLHKKDARSNGTLWTYPYGMILPGEVTPDSDTTGMLAGVPWSKWGVIKGSKPTLPYYDILPTDYLKYELEMAFTSVLLDNQAGSPTDDAFATISVTLHCLLDVHIGSSWNAVSKIWDNLLAFHRWHFNVKFERDMSGAAGAGDTWFFTGSEITDIYGVFDKTTGKPSGKWTGNIQLKLFPEYKFSTDARDNLITAVISGAEGTDSSVHIKIGTTSQPNSPIPMTVNYAFNFPGKFPKDTGMYVTSIIDNVPLSVDRNTSPNNSFYVYDDWFGTYIVKNNVYSNVSYNDVLGLTLCSHDTNDGNVRFFNSKVMHIQEDFSQAHLSEIINVYDETNNIFGEDQVLSSKNASTLMKDTGEYIIYYSRESGIYYKNTSWENGDIVFEEEKSMIPDGSNPISIYSSLTGIAWVIAWKEDKLFYSGSRDLINWMEPTEIIEIPTLPEQVVSSLQTASGQIYIIYYDDVRNPTSIRVNLTLKTKPLVTVTETT